MFAKSYKRLHLATGFLEKIPFPHLTRKPDALEQVNKWNRDSNGEYVYWLDDSSFRPEATERGNH